MAKKYFRNHCVASLVATLYICPLFSLFAELPASSQTVTILNHIPSPLTGNIQIEERQLLINGAPFIMKAICYSPVPKGGAYPQDLIFLNPTAENLVTIETDFKMMQQAGINTIRTYQPIQDSRVLDLVEKYNLKTIVPIYNSTAVPTNIIPQIIAILKDRPSTLIWEIGNEWNYNYFYTTDVNSASFVSAGIGNGDTGLDGSLDCIKAVISIIRNDDTAHPISTVIGDLPDDTFWEKLPDAGINLYGINVYAGASFGDRFTRWKESLSNKPLYVAEFGADAFDSREGKKDEAEQAEAIGSLIDEIQANLSAVNSENVLVGGALFEWNDEWWKMDNTQPNIHSKNGFAISNGNSVKWIYGQANTNFFDNIDGGPAYDGVFNEDWFGILSIDRKPRAAYEVVKAHYAPQ